MPLENQGHRSNGLAVRVHADQYCANPDISNPNTNPDTSNMNPDESESISIFLNFPIWPWPLTYDLDFQSHPSQGQGQAKCHLKIKVIGQTVYHWECSQTSNVRMGGYKFNHVIAITETGCDTAYLEFKCLTGLFDFIFDTVGLCLSSDTQTAGHGKGCKTVSSSYICLEVYMILAMYPLW